MSFIQWQSRFDVGVKLIDEQHQLLVKMINDLHAGMQKGEDRGVLGKMINRLVVYAAMHFAREEHYFDLYAYPNREAHIKAHDDFEDQVSRFEQDFKAGKQDLSMDVIGFLSNWLVTHITKTDKKVGPFLNARGIN
jgi:hemerythrin-like metal-binding protein